MQLSPITMGLGRQQDPALALVLELLSHIIATLDCPVRQLKNAHHRTALPVVNQVSGHQRDDTRPERVALCV
eukprot:2439223-Prymnesium_polylepis.1